jgi:hypothetical protein
MSIISLTLASETAAPAPSVTKVRPQPNAEAPAPRWESSARKGVRIHPTEAARMAADDHAWFRAQNVGTRDAAPTSVSIAPGPQKSAPAPVIATASAPVSASTSAPVPYQAVSAPVPDVLHQASAPAPTRTTSVPDVSHLRASAAAPSRAAPSVVDTPFNHQDEASRGRRDNRAPDPAFATAQHPLPSSAQPATPVDTDHSLSLSYQLSHNVLPASDVSPPRSAQQHYRDTDAPASEFLHPAPLSAAVHALQEQPGPLSHSQPSPMSQSDADPALIALLHRSREENAALRAELELRISQAENVALRKELTGLEAAFIDDLRDDRRYVRRVCFEPLARARAVEPMSRCRAYATVPFRCPTFSQRT